MADNYLEKRQESYSQQAARVLQKRAGTTIMHLLKRSEEASIDASYKVRPDQLSKLVEAARVLDASALQYYIVLSSEASIVNEWLEEPFLNTEAYILPGTTAELNDELFMALGRSLQTISLRAAEMGLVVRYTRAFDVSGIEKSLSLSFKPLAVVAVGKALY